MAVLSQRALVPRVPWRTVAVLGLVALLLAALLAAYIGSRQRLPEPFGVARNGLIAYGASGDIYTIDPATDAVRTIAAGPDDDSDPIFSPDGTKIAFLRSDASGSNPGKDVVVVHADGSNPLVVTKTPIPGGPTHLEWANDSASLLAGATDNSAVWIFDATRVGEARVVATDVDPYIRPFRPPDGSAILVRRRTDRGPTLVRLDLETLHQTVLAHGSKEDDLGAARWSPDGSTVVYNASPAGRSDSQRLFIVNADGTDTRQISSAQGSGYDIDAAWSPDGSRIAFTRYAFDGNAWVVRPIGIYTLADGSLIEVGPLARDARARHPSPDDTEASSGEGFQFEWSPDGESLIAVPGEASAHPIVIDAHDGTWAELSPVIQPGLMMQSWQRLAP